MRFDASTNVEEPLKIELSDGEPLEGDAAYCVPDSEIAKELYSYKRMLDDGLITEEEYNGLKASLFRRMNISSEGNSSISVISLWICNICNFLGIFVNMMISLGVWGNLRSMYKYIMYGYIAGFAFIAVCTPLIIGLSISLKEKAKTDAPTRGAIIGGVVSIALTIFMMILSAIL